MQSATATYTMLARAKTFVRRHVRGLQRGGSYPLLLPHHTLADGRMRSVDGAEFALPAALAKALRQCDGQRTLAEIARQSGAARADLIKAQDDGLLLAWRLPVPADPPMLTHSPHAIIVSPHPDDAALSCGGRMLGDQSVLVVNVFTRSAWWRFPDLADVDRIQACRRAEEQLVSRLSGCPQQALDLPEALLRGHAMADVFTAIAGARDAEVSTRITDEVAKLAHDHPLAHWYLPLGIGDHIDHRIVRDAARAALAGVKPTHLHFYEDLPYAARLSKAGPAPDFSDRLPGTRLRDEPLDVDDVINWKLELLRAYWSQFRWPELVDLKTYAKTTGGGDAVEVAWTPA